uniref:Uncharacterized protein n=1 Tax=viral metagenome TaxID=1070528 RepID=A0A6C0HI28_9ZZZZ
MKTVEKLKAIMLNVIKIISFHILVLLKLPKNYNEIST